MRVGRVSSVVGLNQLTESVGQRCMNLQWWPVLHDIPNAGSMNMLKRHTQGVLAFNGKIFKCPIHEQVIFDTYLVLQLGFLLPSKPNSFTARILIAKGQCLLDAFHGLDQHSSSTNLLIYTTTF